MAKTELRIERAGPAKDADVTADIMGLPNAAKARKFFMVEQAEIDGKHGFADEKLSLILTVYRARDFDEAKDIVRRILNVTGKGHSAGIHTANLDHARELAAETDVVRILVNQAHTFGNGGSFNNCLPFTLSMGGGTWAGNTRIHAGAERARVSWRSDLVNKLPRCCAIRLCSRPCLRIMKGEP